jgi:glycosyltransferase involved in cell wall biosynthesis
VQTLAPEGGEAVRSALAARGASFSAVRLQRASVSPRHDLVYALDVYRLLRRTRPDAYFGYTIKPVTFGSLAACLARVPRRFAMITGLGFTFQKDDWLGRLVRFLYRLALARCHRVFFQNPDDAEEFTRRGLVHPDRVVLTNGSGVDLEHYAASECPAGAPRFLLIGRLLRTKGIGEYLAAAKICRAEHPSARFGLVGGCDPNPDSYQAADVEPGAAKGLWSTIPDRGCPPLPPGLHRLRAAVLPGGHAANGAGSPGHRSGRHHHRRARMPGNDPQPPPAVGAPPGVLMGDNGYLVPPRDATALVWTMNQFFANPDLAARMGVAGRRYAEERYEAGRVASDMLMAMGIT